MRHNNWLIVRINSAAQHTDFKNLYEQGQIHNCAQQIVIDELRQDNNLLRLQILELQKFIFSGKEEKFKLNPTSNEQPTGSCGQIALFENDKLAQGAIECIKHVKAHDVKQTIVRVNHPGRKSLPAHLRR